MSAQWLRQGLGRPEGQWCTCGSNPGDDGSWRGCRVYPKGCDLAGPLKHHPLGFWDPTFSSMEGSAFLGSRKSSHPWKRRVELQPTSANPVTSQGPGLTETRGRTFRGRWPGVLTDDRDPTSLLSGTHSLGAGFSGDSSARIRVTAEEGGL